MYYVLPACLIWLFRWLFGKMVDQFLKTKWNLNQILREVQYMIQLVQYTAIPTDDLG